ncbi:hypothetical protein W97_03891 [Coniosporium apollinis CBS 100218]|uniref:Uncharacterized protein n=1 Tax=Coniosporium apollinis (strain CBS 100218) TaxID=1168221 RepID=R7YS45_CONA1|nr:uncharacterized protein W97_03891 [Coniosporium apollinis CBS 100218]EON64658.1 hypothetical protein W97_03891 [Coniosporium apollinis CBS 100218]
MLSQKTATVQKIAPDTQNNTAADRSRASTLRKEFPGSNISIPSELTRQAYGFLKAKLLGRLKREEAPQPIPEMRKTNALPETAPGTNVDAADRSRATMLQKHFPHAKGIPVALTRQEYDALKLKLVREPEPQTTLQENAERLREMYPEAHSRVPDRVATYRMESLRLVLQKERDLQRRRPSQDRYELRSSRA